MSNARIELFKAAGIQNWGVPYAFISSGVLPDHSQAVATAFALRLTQQNVFQLLDKQVASIELLQPNIEKFVIDEADAVDMLFDHALDFCQLHVNEAWVAAYSSTPPPQSPVPELRPHPRGSWTHALVQMRLRGLSDETIQDMETTSTDDEVRKFLFELPRSVKPATIKRR